MAVYLGIDYGTKRMGLAWADELRIALPIGMVAGTGCARCLDDLAEVVRERSVTEFVIGYPLHMDGEVGKRAKEVDEFSKKLGEKFGLPVRKVDERLTTLAAEEALAHSAKGAVEKDGKVDAVAASLILQDFLEGGKVIE